MELLHAQVLGSLLEWEPSLSPVPFWDASQEEVTSAFRSEKGSFYLIGRGINTEQITLLFAFLQPGYIPPRLDKVLSQK